MRYLSDDNKTKRTKFTVATNKRKKTVNIDKIDIDKAIVVHEMINTNIQNNIQKITDIFHVFHSTSTIIIIYKQLEK